MKTYSIEEVRSLMMQAWRAGFACTSEGHNAEWLSGTYQELELAGAKVVSEILSGTNKFDFSKPLSER
ncbi:hypothetical protein [Burkholderia stagnalis]|uniref:hypothetical protein n=1 Tax=Burkholderia stagnalis TaxID=1503054 RepID=UPI000F56A9A3|nr:hypothetical protein [Burkholderia stagnalis]RQR11340.1 hypothetical protein DF025_17410 [Burkholderia stagnalis]RQR20370.1 hypothetical protein DF026_17220 [Burkholderia stagnalis]